jgi:hypothetical protein
MLLLMLLLLLLLMLQLTTMLLRIAPELLVLLAAHCSHPMLPHLVTRVEQGQNRVGGGFGWRCWHHRHL